MKKIYLLLTAAALVSVFTLSCSKEEPDSAQPVQPQDEQLPGDGNQPEDPSADEDIPEGMIRLNFALSHENDPAPAAEAPALPESKTSWDGSTHSWDSGDQIRIIWGEGENDYVDATVTNGSVSAVVADADYYYAVYPTTATYTYTAAEGKISVSFGRFQSGSFADANIMAAKSSKAAASFSFKNMTSILKFSTGASAAYNKVTFCANDKTKLNGTVSTTFGDTFTVTNTPAGKDGDLITVNVEASNTYYAAVLPDITLSNGIGFKVEASSQDTGALSTAPLSMDRSAVRNLDVIDNIIRKDWFIKEGGTGKGTSWEDAGGAERLVQLIYPTQSRGAGAGLTAAYRLHKATIHVAAGTYNIQAANGDEVLTPHYNTGALIATIKGGYPTGLSGTATTGYDPENNATIFICNETAATDHVFAVTGTNKVNDFTFEGITFTANPAATETAISGIAFSFTSSVSSNVTFKDCIFKELTSTAGSDTYGGAAVFVYSSVAGKSVTFDGCSFVDNTAVRGGAVSLCNIGTGSDITFKDCAFTRNIATTNQGGSVYIYANGKAIFDNTSFEGDGTTSNAANGAAIAVIKLASATLQNGCSFTNLKTSGSGGAIFNHGTLVADGTTFSGCQAKLGGAIHTDGEATIGNTSACIFTNNIASQNGGAIHFQKTSAGFDSPTLSVSNSSFSGNATDVNADKGGAIAATSNTYEYTISNCSFSNLVAANGGAIHNVGIGTVNGGSTFTVCDVSANGGAIYNGGTITVDGCTITGKGKNTIMNALLGGGIYNAVDASCTVQNNSTIEECALDAGNTHGGGGIWNAGTLTVSSSVLKNNYCGYRGGAIYCQGTVTIEDTEFRGNQAANGGGIHTFQGADCFIKGCTFANNTATNGAALRTEGKSANIAKLVVFNSLFKDNIPATKTGNNGGAVQLTSNYSYSVIANSTFTTTDGTALATGGGNNDTTPKFYILSCTFADNTTADFDRNYNSGWFYNTICASAEFAASRDNLKKAQYYSIFGSNRFEAGGTTTPVATVTDLGKNCLGTYSNGVYPLSTDATYSAHYSEGMSVADLQALSFTNITLTQDQLNLLAKDQKGNDRVVNNVDNKIMGAYVLTQ